MEDLKTVVPCKREFEYKASSATDELRRFARPEIEAFNWSKRASSLPTVKAQGSPLCFLTVHAQHFKEYGLGFIEAWITDSCQCFGVDGLVSFNFRVEILSTRMDSSGGSSSSARSRLGGFQAISPRSLRCFASNHKHISWKNHRLSFVNPATPTKTSKVRMSSSRNKGKQTATADQENHQHSRLRFLKPIVRLACFKLECPLSLLLERTAKWQHRIDSRLATFLPYIPNKFRLLSSFQAQGTYLRLRCCENAYQPRPSEEPPYEKKGTYQRARCINNPSSDKAKGIAQTHKTKWPFFVIDLTSRVLSSHLLPNVPHLSHFTGQRHTLILSHDHIEVEATYTRFSDRRDGSLGVISRGWANFASLCKFQPGGVGIFEGISTEPVTVLHIHLNVEVLLDQFYRRVGVTLLSIRPLPIAKQFLFLHADLVSSFPPPLSLSITVVNYELLLGNTVSRVGIFIMLLCLRSGYVLFPISHIRPIFFSFQDLQRSLRAVATVEDPQAPPPFNLPTSNPLSGDEFCR
ncbi:hypothetical protein Ahy_B01g053011 isoform A [Arachis hypogaea]|uniref:TF-B3 domain-containing protein n=1 Tax=Arachis hypogaea TaxID=3818 RepID=A0A445AQW0_ARAHY|nr:hypothetical protein Ahy_B01g053011 isoform A [Arachis hypogaea]